MQVTFYLRGDVRKLLEVRLYQTDPANFGGEVEVGKSSKLNRDSSYVVVTQLDPTEKQEGLFVRYKVLSKIDGKGTVPVSYQTEYFSYDPTVSYSTSSSAVLVGVLGGSLFLLALVAVLAAFLYRWWW